MTLSGQRELMSAQYRKPNTACWVLVNFAGSLPVYLGKTRLFMLTSSLNNPFFMTNASYSTGGHFDSGKLFRKFAHR